MKLSMKLSRLLGVLILLTQLLLVGCGVNPVTGKSELQFISTQGEIGLGQKNYLPMRQAQGGDYVVDTEINLYVQNVGRRLAKVSDRDLPYEFAVVNDGTPNAWALPGGKIAVNRGLLLELNNEAELAAVLGHEIVHAAARHGAKNQERGMILQGGMLATQIATAGKQNANLIAGGAAIGAQLFMTKYGRTAELDSDYYGMEYMLRAGYDPSAAIGLQETFVRLSQGRQSGWLQGLFASHPPSQQRVDTNKKTVVELTPRMAGKKLDVGRERYQRAIATLVKDKPAYKAHKDALIAAKKKDYKTATSLANKAIRLQPKEAKFYGLKGDLALVQKQYRSAITQYDQAISRYPEYFAFHLHSGMAKKALGDKNGAKVAFAQSNKILPTALANKELGEIALAAGNREEAIKFLSVASQARSAEGQAAAVTLTRLELPTNPKKYISAQLRVAENGAIAIVVSNRSAVPVKNVEVLAGYANTQPQRYRVRGVLPPGKSTLLNTRYTNGSGLQTVVRSAQLAE